MIRSSSDIAKLLRELLKKNGLRITLLQHPTVQLMTLSKGINREWRTIHTQRLRPEVMFLRAELNTPEHFHVFIKADGREQRIFILKSDLYETL